MSDLHGLHLELPGKKRKDSFLAMAEEFHQAGETGWPHGAWKEDPAAMEDFAAFLQREADWREGRNLPEGYVPGITWWMMDGQVVLGTAQLRLERNDHLLNYGGHIGYCIRPSQRRKGYMKRLLPLVLDAAARLGIDKVLVTCGMQNVGSARVIESAGGVFEDARTDPARDKTLRRYWVDLAGRG
ncbi:MAG: GNAT family N-acetyltransferase [Planctomycetota bacterium]